MSKRRLEVAKYLDDHFGQWVEGHEISNPKIGGSEGRRRARELREYGFKIERERIPGRDEWRYRVVGYE